MNPRHKIRKSPPLQRTEHDPRWRAVRNRDARADGRFVYAVRTTGVYAHPSSAARLPRPENVEFFDSPAAARAAGYRASRHIAGDRSHMRHQHLQLVARACRTLDRDGTLSLQQLASQSGLSPWHFHRIFKAITGVTPKAYAIATRHGRLRKRLRSGSQVSTAMLDAGFNSSSRLYADSQRALGMTPGRFRAGGTGAEIRFAVGRCSLGSILVASSERGICAILLGDDPDVLIHDLQDQFPKARLIGGDADFERLVATVVGFVEAPRFGLGLPLDLRGTAFQQRVWRALQRIPVGHTASYSEIARRIGAPQAARAVAQACASNRLAVVIPCHRVIRTDGALSGYRWGVQRKQALLRREAERV